MPRQGHRANRVSRDTVCLPVVRVVKRAAVPVIASGRSKPVKYRQAAWRAPTECRVRIFVILYRSPSGIAGLSQPDDPAAKQAGAIEDFQGCSCADDNSGASVGTRGRNRSPGNSEKSLSRRPAKQRQRHGVANPHSRAEAGACTLRSWQSCSGQPLFLYAQKERPPICPCTSQPITRTTRIKPTMPPIPTPPP